MPSSFLRMVAAKPKIPDLSGEVGILAAYIPNPLTVVGDQLLDVSGNDIHGTIYGAVLNATKDGMKFDGIDDYVDLGTCNYFNGNFTMALRLKFNSLSSVQWFLGNYNGLGGEWVLMGHSPTDNIFKFEIDDNVDKKTISASDSSYNVGTFIDMIGILDRDNNIMNFYVDGNLVGSLDATGLGNVISSNNLVLGKDSDDTRFYLDGEVVDLRIYNYAFTAEQALAYHNLF